MQVLEALQTVVDVLVPSMLRRSQQQHGEIESLWKQAQLIGQQPETGELPQSALQMLHCKPTVPIDAMIRLLDFDQTGRASSSLLMLVAQVHMRLSDEVGEWSEEMHRKLLGKLDKAQTGSVAVGALAHHLTQTMPKDELEAQAGFNEIVNQLGRVAILCRIHSTIDFDGGGSVPSRALSLLQEAAGSSLTEDTSTTVRSTSARKYRALLSSRQIDQRTFVDYFDGYLPLNQLRFEQVALKMMQAAQAVFDPSGALHRNTYLQFIFDMVETMRYVSATEVVDLVSAVRDIQGEQWSDEMRLQMLVTLEKSTGGSGVVVGPHFTKCLDPLLPLETPEFEEAVRALVTVIGLHKLIAKVEAFYLLRGRPDLVQGAGQVVNLYGTNHAKLWTDLAEKYPSAECQSTNPFDLCPVLVEELEVSHKRIVVIQQEIERITAEVRLLKATAGSMLVVRQRDITDWEARLREHREWQAAEQEKWRGLFDSVKTDMNNDQVAKYRRELRSLEQAMVGNKRCMDQMITTMQQQAKSISAMTAERDIALAAVQPVREEYMKATEQWAAAEAKAVSASKQVRWQRCAVVRVPAGLGTAMQAQRDGARREAVAQAREFPGVA